MGKAEHQAHVEEHKRQVSSKHTWNVCLFQVLSSQNSKRGWQYMLSTLLIGLVHHVCHVTVKAEIHCWHSKQLTWGT